jgi:uncharacterized low-complexity protein
MAYFTKKTSLSLAIGAVLGVSLSASAADNPFALKDLNSGYMLASAEGSASQGKKDEEEQDQAKKDKKTAEGKCGGAASPESTELATSKGMEGKCGEGKCGEGKCGAAAPPESAEPETTKGMEGKCGEGKCGSQN